ncbi:DUF3016 domain-containing protein [Thalassotalea sp. Y01]|uniref:DUF3016 domain-containing protein n=1 Tax=Thalassotalea sp. Y01 TaxID=2729613 RepID=UPI00145E30C9|nr:DUF3016 domain-containing protein [Thalassotalea sp. Y01]NMP15175.1 DUF3016 domain-containing protein [Thalassotalea sp. Y01]
MHKLLTLMVAVLLASCSNTTEKPSSVSATDRSATVTLLNPSDFNDIDTGNIGIQSDFEQRVADKLAEALADHFDGKDVTIDIKFTNIDLAGETRFNMQEIRILKDVYIPKMSFEYVIKDSSGKVVREESADIKDMGYLSRTLFGRAADEMIGYDKRMLVEYFEKVMP